MSLYAKVRRMHFRERMPISQIARKTSLSRKHDPDVVEGDILDRTMEKLVKSVTPSYSLTVIFTRVLARTDSTLSMVFRMVTILGFGAGILTLPEWVAIRAGDRLALTIIAVTGAFRQLAITESLRRVPAYTESGGN